MHPVLQLVLDVLDDGSELFGVGMTLSDGRRASNGFEALAAYDQKTNGGNEDGSITNADAVWSRLRLWSDTNHDGISEPIELSPVPAAGITSFDLAWTPSSSVDASGNQLRMVSRYATRAGRATEAHLLADVFFRVFQ